MWLLENKHSPNERMAHAFSSRIEAETYLKKLGPIISNYYRVVHESGNSKQDRMLTEGLVKGDLYNILLPRISIDEYVPADPETDNVVIAFFIKGEPGATIPLKNFADHSRGVLSTDYGDSETIVNTQIVYIEFDRENLEIDDIRDLMIQISMLSELNPEDFTMTFPHTNSKFPYDIELMARYFKSRTEKKNRLAQEKAEKERQKKINKELKKVQAAQRQQQMAQEPSEEQPEARTPAEAMGDMPVKESWSDKLDEEQSQESIPNALKGLAAEAQKAGSFDEFKRDFITQIKHGTYWHVTDNPNFDIDPTIGPRDLSSMAVSHKPEAGKLMITSDLKTWHEYYNTNPETGKRELRRPYAALIDMSEVPRNAYKQVSRGMGNEFMVSDPSNARVISIMPIKKALSYNNRVRAKLPRSEAELREFYATATPFV